MSEPLTLTGLQDIQAQLLAAPEVVRRRVLVRVANSIVVNSQQRALAQQDVEGRAYTPHARGRRRKMLTRLVRHLKILWAREQEVVIGFANNVHAQIAYKQQIGFVQRFEPGSRDLDGSRRELDYYNQPATRNQARALLALNFKVRVRGRPSYTPSIRWITQNLTIGRAGYLLHLLRGERGAWETRLPPRSFLGVAANEIAQLTAAALEEARTALREAA